LRCFEASAAFYVVSDKHSVLSTIFTHVIFSGYSRDPWHQPYKYNGQRDHFTLRSSGPDRKDNTADDIIIASPSE